MNETKFIEHILKVNSVSKAEYARNVGATRQQVANWFNVGSVPKKHLLQTSAFLTKITKSKITIEQILAPNFDNNSERFGAIKTLRKQYSDNTKV
ncbi:hypothetical protein BFG04_04465 [Campylobacter pinnipediorum subsp. pinnipediorum]|uniref:Uncharacterized protein n=1 Tax=Campylobacter pinnipediorum subsp. pinnipediorum TaxID=1660067 RepID=A0AAX0LAB7_9BACT|nr:hypothetical protein [Campylobacter pinnipediorum]OPA77353.1 hypothetical protein BFG04_04465 [Campylobacter pinnipediorum subsp. pinnipediorum]